MFWNNKFSNSLNHCVHRGSSMQPILRSSDLLELQPYERRNIRCGDVIMFRYPNEAEAIVHRIVNIVSEGFITRGDNNQETDPLPVPPEHILGRVIAVRRGRIQKPIFGGRAGLMQLFLKRLRWRLTCGSRPFFRVIYRSLARYAPFTGMLPVELIPRVVAFQAQDRLVLRLLSGTRIIGHYHPIRQAWSIRPPFRLFIDERHLPVPPQENPEQQ